ncbi:MAG: sulfite exporter TauE/SafE family protein [Candidatus Eisenbacteria bacterium]|nr:sulfite exporter TauE/SafE family protein [Candidatus Eisenbacteria bacterium]
MSDLLAAAGSALWLGILTSISPCPLASNVAAVSYISKHAGSSRRVWMAGALYCLGRALTYLAVGSVVVASVLSLPSVSMFLQREMNRILGPLLVLIGLLTLGWLRLPGITMPGTRAWQERAARSGPLGAGLLGILFALSFCPVSAGLFFGSLLPLTAASDSPVLLPLVYGVGTGLPVAVLALLIAGGARALSRGFNAITRFERFARPATGVVFICAGIYLVLTHWFHLSLV